MTSRSRARPGQKERRAIDSPVSDRLGPELRCEEGRVRWSFVMKDGRVSSGSKELPLLMCESIGQHLAMSAAAARCSLLEWLLKNETYCALHRHTKYTLNSKGKVKGLHHQYKSRLIDDSAICTWNWNIVSLIYDCTTAGTKDLFECTASYVTEYYN